MDWLIPIGIVVVVLAGISLLTYLRRVAAATERIADALEKQSTSTEWADEHRP
jgi:hypothetical protein